MCRNWQTSSPFFAEWKTTAQTLSSSITSASNASAEANSFSQVSAAASGVTSATASTTQCAASIFIACTEAARHHVLQLPSPWRDPIAGCTLVWCSRSYSRNTPCKVARARQHQQELCSWWQVSSMHASKQAARRAVASGPQSLSRLMTHSGRRQPSIAAREAARAMQDASCAHTRHARCEAT